MESESLPKYPRTNKLPKFLTTVTPFTKVLALIMYFVFPIIGFALGVKYQRNIDLEQKLNFQSPSQIIQDKARINPNLTPSQPATELKTYKNDLFDFSFMYPASYDIKVDSGAYHSLSISFFGNQNDFCKQNPSEACDRYFKFNQNHSLIDMYVDKGAIDVKTSLVNLKKEPNQGHQITVEKFSGVNIEDGIFHSDVYLNNIIFSNYYWEFPNNNLDYSYTFNSPLPLEQTSDVIKVIKSLKILNNRSSISHPLPITSFTSCSDFKSVSNKSWYNDFVSLLTYSGVGIGDITQACVSQDETLLVIMRSGGYCVAPRVAQYLIKENKYDESVLDIPPGCPGSADKFSSINKSIFNIEGGGGDAGCSSDDYYTYDSSTNILKLIKKYSGCEGDSGYNWTYY